MQYVPSQVESAAYYNTAVLVFSIFLGCLVILFLTVTAGVECHAAAAAQALNYRVQVKIIHQCWSLWKNTRHIGTLFGSILRKER